MLRQYICIYVFKISDPADGVLAPHLRMPDIVACPPFEMNEKILRHMFANSPLNISPIHSEIIPKVSEPHDNF